MTKREGLRERHSRKCPTSKDHSARCRCEPSVEAFVYDRRSGGKLRETFSGPGAATRAKQWRQDTASGLRAGTVRAPTSTTVRQAADEFVAGIRDGSIRNRNRQPFKPSVVRSYEADLRLYVLPELGAAKLSAVTRPDVQALIDRLVADGHSGSKVRNAIAPLRVVYRRAVRRGQVTVSPCGDLELPAAGEGRDRADAPAVFEEAITALGDDGRDIWSAAFYSGLRRGELRGLRWEDVELPADARGGVVHVRRGWDDRAGEILPKSAASVRDVPIPTHLAKLLRERRLRTGLRDGFVFGRSASSPFSASTVRKRALRAWETANTQRAETELEPLLPIGLHECRHSWKTWLRRARVPAELRDEFAGHADHSVAGRYEHTSDEDLADAIKLMDTHLELALTGAQTGAHAAETAS